MLRYSFLLAMMLSAATWIAYNTFRNAVIDRSHWNERAQIELSRSTNIIAPDRGDIFAADGSVLATTLQYYTLRVDFGSDGFDWENYVKHKDSLADSLQLYFPHLDNPDYWHNHLDQVLIKKSKPRGWRLISNVTYADYQKIKQFPFFADRRPGKATGLLAEPMKRRCNPYGAMAKLAIGVMTEDSITGEIHGMSGLERALDHLLYGTPGVNKQVAFTRGIGNWVETPAQRGWDVYSTIDVKMQDIVETRLLQRLQECEGEWGTAVLMEVATGEIKAISNLEDDKTNPGHYIEAMNRAVRPFEPGSVVKTLSLMIAIEDGHVTDLNRVIPIGATFKCFGMGRLITDSHFNSQLTVKGCIEQSSNIGVAKIISEFYRDPQQWHDRIASIGFLDPINSGIWEEAIAKFPVTEKVTLSRQFYGYGCEIPPLRTLSLYNAIANGGTYVRPHLVRRLHRDGRDSIIDIPNRTERYCSEHTARMMRECLLEVVEGAHGTARSLKNDYVTLAGKTGTAYSAAKGGYNTACKRLAFCGFFPAGLNETPKYSCMVLIYHPRKAGGPAGAASTSGTVVRNIAMDFSARGFLGASTETSPAPEPDIEPLTIYASTRAPQLQEAVTAATGAITVAQIQARKYAPGTVPDVTGMGLLDAVTLLENAGIDVALASNGVGRVASQSPAGGSPMCKSVTLTLAP